MDQITARSILGLPIHRLLTTGRVEAAYSAAREQGVRVLTIRPTTAADWEHSSRLDEARIVLVRVAKRMPPWGDALGLLTLIQFFVGGFVLFVAAFVLVLSSATVYDGLVSMIGWVLVPVVVAVPSMVIAFLIGLPLRLIPALRIRWLRNGELTIAGMAVGLTACALVIAVAPLIPMVDEIGPYEMRDINWWALLGAWSLFAFSTAHFVWPLRWVRRD